MDEKKIAKLIRKHAAKAEKAANARRGRAYDPTIDATRGTSADDATGIERQQFFKEMKRREF